MQFKTLCGLVALTAFLAPTAHAARKPCDCANLSQIEREISEQEYLLKLFTQWKTYLPAALRTPDDIRERAGMNFNLTFYGVPSERPDAEGAGAGGAFGTLYKDPACPLVEYLYENGKPKMVETRESKRKKLVPPELEWATQPTSEAKYKSTQCKALVHYAFVHEQSHQATCRRVHSEHRESQWDQPLFFIDDDIRAYKAGLDVLYAERTRLKAKCKTDKRDGRWHGVLQYSYTYNEGKREPFGKGTQIAQPDAVGYFDSADRKSGRVRATIDATDSELNLKVPFTATRQAFYHHSKWLTVTGDCGWRPNVTLIHDGGIEQRSQGTTRGIAEGNLRADVESLSLSFAIESFDGAWDESNWNKRRGDCGPKPNTDVWDSRKRETKMDGFRISMKVPIDPEHPNDIDITRIEPDSSGKGQHYYSLKLHRTPVN